MELSIRKGRNIVISIICILLGLSLMSILLYVTSIGTGKIGTQVVRFFLNAVLCFFIYKGQNWAKWVTVILMSIAALMGLVGALSLIAHTSAAVLPLIYSILYIIVVILLLTSRSVKAFMENQRQ